jgi:CheY-like chemotaxis protein
MAAKKILLVEDDNNLREIYGARLQAEGYDIVSAPDGENALAVAVKEKPDLIISDVMMPKVSGFDMLDILRNAPETKDTKVIMMTALSQAEDKARADKLGADMYLVKSQVTLEDVAKAVHQILDDPSESAQEADSAAAQEMVSPTSTQAGQQSQPEQPQAQKKEQPSSVNAPENTPPAEVPTQQSVQSEPAQQHEPPAKTPEEQAQPPTETKAAEPNPASPGADDASQATKPAEEKPSENQTTSSATTIPVNIADSNDIPAAPPAVEPSLAQALEDEEKAVQEKIDDFEKSGPETSANNTAPAPKEPTIEEQASIKNSPENDQPVQEKKAENPLDEKPKKKVIEPINDPTKGPDLDELVAKEEAKEAAQNSQQANQVIKPQTPDNSGDQPKQNNPDSSSQKNPDDDFGKISL